MSVRAGWLLAAIVCAAVGCAPGRSSVAAPAPACTVVPGTLVDVRAAAPEISVDLRYRTANNFTGAPLPGYDEDRALLRPDAAAALARVQGRLRTDGLGVRVYDAYRPVRATLAMVDWAERTGRQWVLDQGYVARRSGHNRGGTVDLTLVRLATGEPLEMGTAYDDFSERSHTANATGEVRVNRNRLVAAMAAEGWVNYDKEWWHFRFGGDYPELDEPLSCFR